MVCIVVLLQPCFAFKLRLFFNLLQSWRYVTCGENPVDILSLSQAFCCFARPTWSVRLWRQIVQKIRIHCMQCLAYTYADG
jgi:hypothetical protein